VPKKPQPEPEATEEERDYTVYLEKAPTDLQKRFAEWLMDEDIVGYDPSKAKTKQEAFEEGVRLATAMRMVFQASPENRAANEERKAARADESEEEPAKPAKKAAPAKKAVKKAAAPAEEEEPEEEAPAPKKAVAKKAPVKKRRPASDEDEAPF